MRLAALLVVVAGVGCTHWQPVPHGDFVVIYDRYESHALPTRDGRTVTVDAPAPGARADVVPRAEAPDTDRVLVRRPDLPGRGLPIVVAVGNVAVFEAARRVRDVALAGDAAQAWFTPGRELYLRGVHVGTARLRLTLPGGKHRVLRVDVR